MTPAASVVVCTYNRAPILPRLLDALAAQRGVDRFEIVVVDNGSTDETPDVLARYEAAGLPLITIRRPANGGPAPARNAGWRAASADIVAFTDDDCRPEPDWLASLLRGMAFGHELVAGRTIPDPDDADQRGTFGHTVAVPRKNRIYECCNIAYRRAVLESLDGFDEGYGGRSFGEDVDLGWRAVEAGARPGFAPQAVVRHQITPSDPLGYLRTRGRLAGIARVLADHPEVRSEFPGGWFYLPTHRTALELLAAAGWMASRRSKVSAALTAAAGVRYWRSLNRAARLGPLAAKTPAIACVCLAGDLLEIGALAYGSAKHRTVVL